MDIIKEQTETAVVDRPTNNSDPDSLPFLPSNSDDNISLTEELEYLFLLPPDE